MSSLPSSPDPATDSSVVTLHQLHARIAELEASLEQSAREKSSWAQNKRLLQLVADHVDDLFAVVDCHGRRIWNNQAYEHLLGYAPEDLQGSYSFMEIHPDDQMKVAAAFADTMQNGTSERIEYRMQHKNGDWVLLESRSRAIYDDEKRVQYIILVARDISRRNLQEQERAKDNQLETLSVVAKGVAKEFNTIISAMHSHVTAARQVAPAGTAVAGRLTEAERAALRANEIMQRLSYVIDDENAPRHEIPPGVLLQEIAGQVTRHSLGRCEFLMPADLRQIFGEENAVRVLFTEILTNAAQALKTHGVIRVLGENLVISPEQSTGEAAVKPGRYVAIHIMDQGIGIAETNRPHVFDPYFTTKPNSLGMGLTTALSIAKRHGGNIRVTSTENVGTTVSVLLPTTESEVSPILPTTRVSHPSQSSAEKAKGTVLIMDDEPLVCEFAATAFEHLGYTPTITNDGARAIEVYAKAKFKGTPYNFVFLDLIVPHGVSGMDAYMVLLKMNPDVRVIIVSGNVDHPLMKEPEKHGISAAMKKPYTIEGLQKVLKQLEEAAE